MARMKTAITVGVIVALLGAGGALAFPVVTGPSGGTGDEQLSPEKAAILQAEAERQQQAAATSEATPLGTPVLSCPRDSSGDTFVRPFDGGPFHPKQTIYFTNVARVLSDPGQPTWIYAGAISTDRQQGVLFVQNEELDPCAAALNPGDVSPIQVFLTPYKWGRVTIAAVSSKSIEFTTDSGVKGSFDLAAHSFLVDGIALSPLATPVVPGEDTLIPTPTVSARRNDESIVATPSAGIATPNISD